MARLSDHFAPTFLGVDSVFSDQVVIFPFPDHGWFAVLQSCFHETWCRRFASYFKGDLRYNAADCFVSFPLPEESAAQNLQDIGQRFFLHRQMHMERVAEGLTKTYNRFHDPNETSSDIQSLHELQIEMDQAVAAAYGWTDLDLGHGFHDTKQGVRFTISEPARREVLQRLLKLNHERYAEEVKQGLHAKKGRGTGGAGRGKKAKISRSGPTLFGDDDDEPGPAGAMGEASDVDETSVITQPRSTSNRSADEAATRPTPIEELATDEIMAAFRQAARGCGSLERDELLKEASLILGFQRLGPKIEETLRGHLRAAIRRGIIEADGANLVRAATTSMADYDLEALRESFRSVMRKGANYEREEVIHDLARYLGFARVTDTSRDAIKSAINSAIRQGILGYEGNEIWREE